MTTHEVKGNTLRVYLCLLRHGPCELREVQHELGFSTASLASYHLDRLIQAGYARQDEQGKYVATKEASGKILDGYSKIGPAIVPQLFFFTLLFTILAVFFSLEALYQPRLVIYLVLASLGMVLVLWYQTFKLWRKLVD